MTKNSRFSSCRDASKSITKAAPSVSVARAMVRYASSSWTIPGINPRRTEVALLNTFMHKTRPGAPCNHSLSSSRTAMASPYDPDCTLLRNKKGPGTGISGRGGPLALRGVLNILCGGIPTDTRPDDIFSVVWGGEGSATGPLVMQKRTCFSLPCF